MRFINFAIVKLAICLALGVAIAHSSKFPSQLVFSALPYLFLVLLLLWFLERKKLRQGVFFGMLTYVLFILIGFANYQVAAPKLKPFHYAHFYTESATRSIQLTIEDVLKPSVRQDKYLATVNWIDTLGVQGEVLLQVKKDSTASNLQIDDVIWVITNMREIQPPLNPYQFDYKKYLELQGVYHQITISTNEIVKSDQRKRSLRGYANSIRNHFIQKLSETGIEKEQRSIIHALLLGQRNDIDKNLYKQYAAAGALHILAVSGLHVGILFLLLSWVSSPILYFKNGKTFQAILIVIFLWCFALLAGLSPSVVRAVTMFSFFALAKMLRRPTHSMNTLFLSFLVLLLFEPQWLFHVGFQLSYLAVFAILWIQPKLNALYRPRYYLDRLLWGITTVTIAAQLGIAPLSLYYFHQFPGLFFVTNIVILPFLAILLAGGIVILILAVIGALPPFLAAIYNEVIKLLNRFIQWVANQESYVFENIPFTLPMVVMSYVSIILLWHYWVHKKRSSILKLLGCALVWIAIIQLKNYQSSKEQFMVFHASRNTLLGHQQHRKLRLFSSSAKENVFQEYPIKDYVIGSWTSYSSSEVIPSILSFKEKHFLILDSLGVYSNLSLPETQVQIQVVILTHSPRLHLERLIDSLQPKLIIADGSNYHSYVARWRKTCSVKNIEFHHTGTDGAFTFK